jgi:hypothetical protein
MPNCTPHAVYNLDESVAVGDNPFYNTAIEEAAYDSIFKNSSVFSIFDGSKVFVYKGMSTLRLIIITLYDTFGSTSLVHHNTQSIILHFRVLYQS